VAPVRDGPRVALAALFITALVTAQILAVKVVSLPRPGALSFLGPAILVPAGVAAYALTFFATDCYGELYGRRQATVLVNVGFAMNFVMLGLLWLAIWLPGSPAGVDPTTFGRVLGPSTNVVLGSLLAYLVSQNLDVFSFHALGELTNGDHLWLRNIGSTGTSQLVDTLIFISVAFWAAPVVLGLGQALPGAVVVQLVVGQYLVKLLLALLDTPFIYLIVGYVHGVDPATRSPARTV